MISWVCIGREASKMKIVKFTRKKWHKIREKALFYEEFYKVFQKWLWECQNETLVGRSVFQDSRHQRVEPFSVKQLNPVEQKDTLNEKKDQSYWGRSILGKGGSKMTKIVFSRGKKWFNSYKESFQKKHRRDLVQFQNRNPDKFSSKSTPSQSVVTPIKVWIPWE